MNYWNWQAHQQRVDNTVQASVPSPFEHIRQRMQQAHVVEHDTSTTVIKRLQRFWTDKRG